MIGNVSAILANPKEAWVFFGRHRISRTDYSTMEWNGPALMEIAE
jgi:hypothetical protein